MCWQTPLSQSNSRLTGVRKLLEAKKGSPDTIIVRGRAENTGKTVFASHPITDRYTNACDGLSADVKPYLYNSRISCRSAIRDSVCSDPRTKCERHVRNLWIYKLLQEL